MFHATKVVNNLQHVTFTGKNVIRLLLVVVNAINWIREPFKCHGLMVVLFKPHEGLVVVSLE